MRFVRNWAWLAGCGVLLAACGGSHQASSSHFETVLQQYGRQHGVCLPLALNVMNADGVARQTMLGSDKIVLDVQNQHGAPLNEAAAKQMAVLVENGLYRQDAASALQVAFSLTEKGLTHTQSGLSSPLFCIGKQQVEKVLYFTEPAANAQGLIVSQVVYEADVRLENWAKQLLERGAADWKSKLQTRRIEQAMLIKTNEGWRDVRTLPQPDWALPQ